MTEQSKMPARIWASTGGLPFFITEPDTRGRFEEFIRADLVEQMAEALRAIQFGFNFSRCPACAGWGVGPNGETDMVHTKDCIVHTALSTYAAAVGSKEATP